jgi:sugar lactone lactonase YvrE
VAGSDQISAPGGIFIDRHNTLFIADQYNYRIVKVEYRSTNVTIVLDGLNYPDDLVIDSKGTMFIAEKESLTCWPKGARNGTILGRARWLMSVTLDPKEEHLYVTDYFQTYVKKYATNGGAEQNGTVVIPNVNSRKFFSFCVCLTTVFLSLSVQPGALQ